MQFIKNLWNATKEAAAKVVNVAREAVVATAIAVGLFISPQAQAALPAGTEAVFTGIATDFGTLLGYGMVLLLVIVGGLAMVGLIRRVVNKVT